MTRLLPLALVALPLAGCVSAPVARPTKLPDRAPPSFTDVGLERVMGQSAPALIALFGEPDADVREGDARKLQFAGPICVLDTYLYPKHGKQVVTYVDARQPSGAAIDRASCVAALTRRKGGK
ncbi:hypothetical protein [Hephaestia mangrovi]|uniref:hypothetical protein n=1 Tax=Hephaestia mangrovi TaxID=2873268 RepID=UPI001CA665F5|nr:hypothetical protein [Hephaestia mangrovi]MBY8829246.1 hypothetical protein [Hephaestia mangrovi]